MIVNLLGGLSITTITRTIILLMDAPKSSTHKSFSLTLAVNGTATLRILLVPYQLVMEGNLPLTHELFMNLFLKCKR